MTSKGDRKTKLLSTGNFTTGLVFRFKYLFYHHSLTHYQGFPPLSPTSHHPRFPLLPPTTQGSHIHYPSPTTQGSHTHHPPPTVITPVPISTTQGSHSTQGSPPVSTSHDSRSQVECLLLVVGMVCILFIVLYMMLTFISF